VGEKAEGKKGRVKRRECLVHMESYLTAIYEGKNSEFAVDKAKVKSTQEYWEGQRASGLTRTN